MSSAVYPTLPGLMWPVKRTPVWNTRHHSTPSGREFSASFMTSPRYRYALQYEFLRNEAAYGEYQALFGFFNLRQGSGETFLFSDPEDRAVTAQAMGTGNGSTGTFQLVRSLGGHTQAVFDVDSTAGAPQIFVGGALRTLGTHYTITATGLVSFVTPPGAGVAVTWTGRYYWRVRFDSDEQTFEQFMQQFWRTGEVRLITVKP